MKTIIIFLLLSSILAFQYTQKEDKPCPGGNHFLFLSTFALGTQRDLNKTINQISENLTINEVQYQDELYRSYIIYNISKTISYTQSKQSAALKGNNVLRITGGTAKITFNFKWEKTQLGSSLQGYGSGVVSTDPITFEKTLLTNSSHQLQWNLTFSEPISITNGLSLSKVYPYRAADYQILSNMLNKLKNNQTTVKDNFVKGLNYHYEQTLRKFISQDQTLKFNDTINYSYADYRDIFEVTYTQTLMNSTLAEDGLYLLFSQKIVGDDQFECGSVPQVPSDTSVFGGLQQFLSNGLLKSTLKWALKKGFLDVILTQQFWQSRAFQFYIGDVHEVMPNSTKNMSTMEELKGKCIGLNDPVFNFAYKSATAYEVKVNFECYLNITSKIQSTKIVTIDVVATYQVAPKLNSKTLDFVLNSIGGKPSFVQIDNYKVEYPQLAEFMVSETMAVAKGGKVIGSDYKMDKNIYRKYPNVWVKPDYLFMYDSTVKPKANEKPYYQK